MNDPLIPPTEDPRQEEHSALLRTQNVAEKSELPAADVEINTGQGIEKSSNENTADPQDGDSAETETMACGEEDVEGEESSMHQLDAGLLQMIENGEVEYAIEEEEHEEAEEEPQDDHAASHGSENVEINCFDIGLELPPPSEDSISSTSSPKKRPAAEEYPPDSVPSQEKKPRLSVDDKIVSPPAPSADPAPSAIPADSIQDPPLNLNTTEPAHTAPPTASNNRSKSKGASRPPASRQPPSTPSSIMTRRGALAASTSGMVPEHSHTLPKFMPKAPIRAIEIPVWSIRESYDMEEDLRTRYQAEVRSKSTTPKENSQEMSIAELEARFWALSEKDIDSSGSQLNEEEEKNGEDDAYAELHYKYEILERLRWTEGPGSDRFKQEDAKMTVEQFRASALRHTYRSSGNGRLLAEEKWAQNMTNSRPRAKRTARSTPIRVPQPTVAKGSSAIMIPKGFVLKIKSSSGTTIIGKTSAPPGSSSSTSSVIGSSMRSAPKTPGQIHSAKKATVKRAASPSAAAASNFIHSRSLASSPSYYSPNGLSSPPHTPYHYHSPTNSQNSRLPSAPPLHPQSAPHLGAYNGHSTTSAPARLGFGPIRSTAESISTPSKFPPNRLHPPVPSSAPQLPKAIPKLTVKLGSRTFAPAKPDESPTESAGTTSNPTLNTQSPTPATTSAATDPIPPNSDTKEQS